LLDTYVINDTGIEKTAAQEVDCLTKIANKESLSQNDIITAANQYVEFVKIAEEAEKKGEEDADELVEKLNEAAEEGEEGEDAAAEAATDPEVAQAVQVLQDKGIL